MCLSAANPRCYLVIRQAALRISDSLQICPKKSSWKCAIKKECVFVCVCVWVCVCVCVCVCVHVKDMRLLLHDFRLFYFWGKSRLMVVLSHLSPCRLASS